MKIIPLVRNLALTLSIAGLVVWLAHFGPTVHLPLLALVLGSGVLGFFEPKWGWLWVLAISGLVVTGHVLFKLPENDHDTATFVSFFAPFPALIGGLLGRISRKVI